MRVVLTFIIYITIYRMTQTRKKTKEKSGPKIETVHVVNLDRDIKRWTALEPKLKNISPLPQRWTAVYGKDLVRTDMHKLGVGFVMVHSGKGTYAQQHKDLRNLGTVGCFLSHKALLSSLSNINLPDDAAHLVLEDDIEVPKNFLKANDRWSKLNAQIPQDWDIVYLGIHNPIGKLVKPNILKLTHATQDQGNWGTHAYIIRHGALKDKVLPWLTYMIDAIDLQLNIKFDEWNVYSIQPDIIKLNKKQAQKSTIQTM